jgi:hypothetical protein
MKPSPKARSAQNRRKAALGEGVSEDSRDSKPMFPTSLCDLQNSFPFEMISDVHKKPGLAVITVLTI